MELDLLGQLPNQLQAREPMSPSHISLVMTSKGKLGTSNNGPHQGPPSSSTPAYVLSRPNFPG